MKELSLDEYRLMMGTQMWLKESLFEFLETLFTGGKKKPSVKTVTDLDNELRRTTDELSRKVKSPPKPPKRKGLQEANDKLKELLKDDKKSPQTGKQQSELPTREECENVDVSNWNVLVNDNTHKRDQKVGLLNEKLKLYKKQGYLKD